MRLEGEAGRIRLGPSEHVLPFRDRHLVPRRQVVHQGGALMRLPPAPAASSGTFAAAAGADDQPTHAQRRPEADRRRLPVPRACVLGRSGPVPGQPHRSGGLPRPTWLSTTRATTKGLATSVWPPGARTVEQSRSPNDTFTPQYAPAPGRQPDARTSSPNYTFTPPCAERRSGGLTFPLDPASAPVPGRLRR